MYGDFRRFLEVYCHSPEAWGQGLMETKKNRDFLGIIPKNSEIWERGYNSPKVRGFFGDGDN
jgi:hypothetical protein